MGDSDEGGSKAASTQEKSERKYIPRRYASTGCITKQSQNQTTQSLRSTNDAYEGDGSKNFAEQNQTMNKISARFSLSRGMEKRRNRKMATIWSISDTGDESKNVSSNSNNRDNEEGNQIMKNPVSTMPRQSKSIGTPKNTTIQVLVSSNSNNPAALRSETKSGVEV